MSGEPGGRAESGCADEGINGEGGSAGAPAA